MNITQQKTVAEIVTQNIKTAHIFKKYGIDFCCGGGITVEKACAKNNVDFSTLENDLKNMDAAVPNVLNYDSWDLDFLADHIVNVHHKYVTENSTLLMGYATKVATVHGHHYTEVVKINDLVLDVIKELAVHMKKEELILFPFIKQVVLASKIKSKLKPAHFGNVTIPIQMLEDEHEKAGDIFKNIAKLSNNYTPPDEACNTFKALYSKLKEFEQDLHHHIHLENNILFPKVIKLEQQLL